MKKNMIYFSVYETEYHIKNMFSTELEVPTSGKEVEKEPIVLSLNEVDEKSVYKSTERFLFVR